MCLFTAVTVRGSGVGGADKKKRKKAKQKKVKREAAAAFVNAWKVKGDSYADVPSR